MMELDLELGDLSYLIDSLNSYGALMQKRLDEFPDFPERAAVQQNLYKIGAQHARLIRKLEAVDQTISPLT
jgi:hypothetical protein